MKSKHSRVGRSALFSLPPKLSITRVAATLMIGAAILSSSCGGGSGGGSGGSGGVGGIGGDGGTGAIGGGSGGSDSDPLPTATAMGTPAGTLTSAAIGAAGGALSTPDGKVSLTIPAGALAADTDIGILPITNMAHGGLGTAYRLTPDGQQFAQPVTLSFTYSADDLVGTAPEALGVAFQTPEGYWQLADDISVDAGAETVSATTTHFTDWGYVEQFRINPVEKVVGLGEGALFQVEMCYPVKGERDAQGNQPILGTQCGPFSVSIAGLLLSNWSVNGVTGGDSVYGTVHADVDRGGYLAPETAPDNCVVALSVDLKDLSDEMLKASLVANITIVGCEGYKGTVAFDIAFQGVVSGASTVTWTKFEQPAPGEQHFLASGDLDVTITLPDCDPLQVVLPIDGGTPSFPGSTLVVFTAPSPWDGRYAFGLAPVPRTLTFSCGDPRQPITIENYTFLLPVGSCYPNTPPADFPVYTDLGSLDGDYTCPAIAPSVLGIDAFWVFLRQGAP